MRYLFITILLLQLFNSAYAQILITGRVTSLDTKENLSGVSITLNSTKVTYKTSVDGTFSFRIKNADSVIFSHIGYQL